MSAAVHWSCISSAALHPQIDSQDGADGVMDAAQRCNTETGRALGEMEGEKLTHCAFISTEIEI